MLAFSSLPIELTSTDTWTGAVNAIKSEVRKADAGYP